MDPWKLITNNKYSEAYDEYSQLLEIDPDDSLNLANRGIAALCLEKLDLAYEDFLKANELEREISDGISSPYINDLAVIEWLRGNREQAISLLKSIVDDVHKGTIEFIDIAGGVDHGLLYWFTGVMVNDDSVCTYSFEYLEKLIIKSRIKYWPGPLALFIMNKINYQKLLSELDDSANISSIKRIASNDLLIRRRLCQAIFYNAIKKYGIGDEEGYITGLKECAEIENPILELEWYIAYWELKKIGEQ